MLIIAALLVVCDYMREENGRRGVVEVIDKDTIITEPKVTDEKPVGTLTVSVPKIGVDVPKVSVNVPKLTQNVIFIANNVNSGEGCDSIATYETEEEAISVRDKGDSYDVDIPITQKRYEDSLYTAWVSGYKATLDSIRVRERTVIIAAEPRASKKRPRISVGLTGGVGLVGLKGDTGAGWFAGVGVTVPLWPK